MKLLFCLLALSFNLFCMESRQSFNYDDTTENNQQYYFDNEHFEESLIEELISNRPKEISMAISMVQDPQKFYRQNKKLLLVGKPGVGKSMLAKAIALKTGAQYRFIDASAIGNKYQDSGQEMLREYISPFLSVDKSTVIVIDEISNLFDHYTNENFQDSKTTTALQQLLDRCKNNRNIFFIGTTNDIQKMPTQLKSRFAGDIVEIPLPNALVRERIIRYYLGESHDLSNKYIQYLTRISDGLAARELEQLVIGAEKNAFCRGVSIISQEDCKVMIQKMGFNSWNLRKSLFWWVNDSHLQTAVEVTKFVLPIAINAGVQYYISERQSKVHKTGQSDQSKAFKQSQKKQLKLMKDFQNEQISLQKTFQVQQAALQESQVASMKKLQEDQLEEMKKNQAKQFKLQEDQVKKYQEAQLEEIKQNNAKQLHLAEDIQKKQLKHSKELAKKQLDEQKSNNNKQVGLAAVAVTANILLDEQKRNAVWNGCKVVWNLSKVFIPNLP